MPGYDAVEFDPPAPVARVELRNSATGAVVANVPMLIDTGADATLLPHSAVQQLGARIQSQSDVALVGFDGNKSIPSAVTVDMVFLSGTFRGMFLPSEQPYGVIGRDVLNHFHLTLDGAGLTWAGVKASRA